MAIIQCGECGGNISDAAVSCPKCGNPRPGTITTQQTSKKYKAAQLISIVFFGAGMVACSMESAGASAALWVIGVSIYVAGRFGAWWDNG